MNEYSLYEDIISEAEYDVTTKIFAIQHMDNGRFRIELRYDVYNELPHPDPEVHALSTHGELMLQDYLYLHSQQ